MEMGEPFGLPDVTFGQFWIDLMEQCGLCLYSSGIPVPLTFQEIYAWSSVAKIDLAGYEPEVMRKLSEHYVNFWAISKNPAQPDPVCDNAETTLTAFKSFVERFRE